MALLICRWILRIAVLVKGRQTIRWFRRSDQKPVQLPFRLKNSEHLHAFPYPDIEDSTFPHQPKAGGPSSLSPERETCCLLFISEAMAFLLSLSVSSSVMLSFVPTYCNQLSPASFGLAVRLTADRPTMHRKFLRISNVRELWAMKRIL